MVRGGDTARIGMLGSTAWPARSLTSCGPLIHATAARLLATSIINDDRNPCVPPSCASSSLPLAETATHPTSCCVAGRPVGRRRVVILANAALSGVSPPRAAAANVSMSAAVERMAPAPASASKPHHGTGRSAASYAVAIRARCSAVSVMVLSFIPSGSSTRRRTRSS